VATVHLPFEKRIRKITRNHDRLIIARPRRRSASVPLRGVLLVIAAGFAFKGFLHADLGQATYGDRISASQSGTLIEKGGAWLMQVDPVTVWVAEQINTFLH